MKAKFVINAEFDEDEVCTDDEGTLLEGDDFTAALKEAFVEGVIEFSASDIESVTTE